MRRLVVPLAVVLIQVAASWVHASLITNAPNLPPPDGMYVMSPGSQQSYGSSFEIKNLRLYGFPIPGSLPPQNDNDTTLTPISFTSIFEADLIGLGPPHITGIVHGGFVITKNSGVNGSSLGTFETEMVQLDLIGIPNVLVRESPTLKSQGQTTIADQGGGLFKIDSFFDVFTELSIDGGQNWIPAQRPGHVDLTSVPEPSTLALATIGALLGLARVRRWRRQKQLGNSRT